MKIGAAKFQIGKQGVTEGAIDSLFLATKYHKQVRISVLKSTGRDKKTIGEMADDIVKRLSVKYKLKYKYIIIGFIIILKKGK